MDKLIMWAILTSILTIPTIIGAILFGYIGLIVGFSIGGICLTKWVLDYDKIV